MKRCLISGINKECKPVEKHKFLFTPQSSRNVKTSLLSYDKYQTGTCFLFSLLNYARPTCIPAFIIPQTKKKNYEKHFFLCAENQRNAIHQKCALSNVSKISSSLLLYLFLCILFTCIQNLWN